MEKDLIYLGKIEFEDTLIDGIAGGFGGENKCILAKDVSKVHDVELKRINENINRLINNNRIREGVHYLNLFKGKSQVAVGDLELKVANRTKNVFLLSERGYFSLIKYMDDDKSWEVHDALVDEYFQLKEDNVRLVTDNTELHKIAVSDDEQKEREYQADKVRYGWQNIRTVLKNCDYRTIEDEVNKIIEFHTKDLKKRDRANYPSHKEANNTEYKQIVRDRLFEILDDITNTTLDGVLRAVTSELRVNVIKDKLSTTNRSNARIQSNLERELEAIRPPHELDYITIDYHPFSANYLHWNDKRTPEYNNWIDNFPVHQIPAPEYWGINLNKRVKLYIQYTAVKEMDTDNVVKSLQDQIFGRIYGIDDNLVDLGEVVRVDTCDSYADGQMRIYICNTDTDSGLNVPNYAFGEYKVIK